MSVIHLCSNVNQSGNPQTSTQDLDLNFSNMQFVLNCGWHMQFILINIQLCSVHNIVSCNLFFFFIYSHLVINIFEELPPDLSQGNIILNYDCEI